MVNEPTEDEIRIAIKRIKASGAFSGLPEGEGCIGFLDEVVRLRLEEGWTKAEFKGVQLDYHCAEEGIHDTADPNGGWAKATKAHLAKKLQEYYGSKDAKGDPIAVSFEGYFPKWAKRAPSRYSELSDSIRFEQIQTLALAQKGKRVDAAEAALMTLKKQPDSEVLLAEAALFWIGALKGGGSEPSDRTWLRDVAGKLRSDDSRWVSEVTLGYAEALELNWKKALALCRRAGRMIGVGDQFAIPFFLVLRRTEDAARALEESLDGPDIRAHEGLIGWGRICAIRGDVRGAVSRFQKALAVSPDDVDAMSELCLVYLQAGLYKAALGVVVEHEKEMPNYLRVLAGGLAGLRDWAVEEYEVARGGSDYTAAELSAMAIGAGKQAEAVTWLRKATVDDRSGALFIANTSATFKELWDREDYQELLRDIKLPLPLQGKRGRRRKS